MPSTPLPPNTHSRLAAHSPSQGPATPLDRLDADLRQIIQTLLELSINLYGYTPPHSTDSLTHSLTSLSTSLSSLSPPNPELTTTLPREIIQYVAQGRNPDIYTREFVEVVQKMNALAKGRTEAFRGFAEVLAEQVNGVFPELGGEVGRVMEGVGRE